MSRDAAHAALDRATTAIIEARAAIDAIPEPEPPPPAPPPGPPQGEVIAADPCELPTAEAIELWGGYQGEGPHRIEHHLDGGPFPYRRFLLAEGDRDASDPRENERNELGGRDFATFEVGSRYVTRFWNRLPTIPTSEYRTIFQWKHTEKNIVSTSPPLSLLQYGNATLVVKERAGNYNGRELCRIPIPINEWFETAFDITYARLGHVEVWLDGESVFQADAPTAKELTDGGVSASYPRCGIYQRASMRATWRDLGPLRIERIA
jgi:hypothetical protein